MIKKYGNIFDLDKEREHEFFLNDKENALFKIKALFPKDDAQIARMMVIKQNGLPANSFSDIQLYNFEREATIEVALLDKPDWFAIDDCPESEILDNIFEEIKKWSDEFQLKLKKNRPN